jgi:hypothetical protein
MRAPYSHVDAILRSAWTQCKHLWDTQTWIKIDSLGGVVGWRGGGKIGRFLVSMQSIVRFQDTQVHVVAADENLPAKH